MHLRYVYDFKIWQTEEYLITHQNAASHFVLTQQDFKSDRVRNLVVQWVLFRISFWFRDAFEDGEKEMSNFHVDLHSLFLNSIYNIKLLLKINMHAYLLVVNQDIWVSLNTCHELERHNSAYTHFWKPRMISLF